MNVYVVMGQTGEYSDNRNWLVCAFFDEEKAKQHVELASARAREIYAGYLKEYEAEEINEHDDKMEMTYNGVIYGYHAVEVKD